MTQPNKLATFAELCEYGRAVYEELLAEERNLSHVLAACEVERQNRLAMTLGLIPYEPPVKSKINIRPIVDDNGAVHDWIKVNG